MGWTTAVWDGAAADWPWHREHPQRQIPARSQDFARTNWTTSVTPVPHSASLAAPSKMIRARMGGLGGGSAARRIVTAIKQASSVSLCTYW
jgi:hypothetical protein